MTVWFVAGAGTEVGKTYVAAGLIRRWRASGRPVQALKPVASGVAPVEAPEFAESDTALLIAALGLPLTTSSVEACSPWRFAAPLSPDMAAEAEGRRLAFTEVRDWCLRRIGQGAREGVTLVEGVGGVMSPVAEDALNLDLIKALDCPVILVGGAYLGALSHMLTALETLKAHEIRVGPIILNESVGSTVAFESSLKTLRRFAPGETVVALRRGDFLSDPDLP